MDFRLRCLAPLLLLGTHAVAGQVKVLVYDEYGQPIRSGTVSVYETDEDLNPLPDPLIEIVRPDGDTRDSFDFEVPNGDYEIRVALEGFHRADLFETVESGLNVFRTVLRLGSIGSPLPGAEIAGKVIGGSQNGHIWVRLVPFLGEWEYSVPVAEDGAFDFGGVRGGLHTLTVLQDGPRRNGRPRLLHARLVTIRWEDQSIEIQLDE